MLLSEGVHPSFYREGTTVSDDYINPEVAKILAMKAFMGPLTDSISGSIIEQHSGITKAKCPVCPHLIIPCGMGFRVESTAKNDRNLTMCGHCCTFLFITPPGFTVINAEEYAKLPQDIRTLMERIRERVLNQESLLPP